MDYFHDLRVKLPEGSHVEECLPDVDGVGALVFRLQEAGVHQDEGTRPPNTLRDDLERRERERERDKGSERETPKWRERKGADREWHKREAQR